MDEEAVKAIDTELEKPQPDPDVLGPMPVGYTLADEQSVSHLCRAILRAEASEARLTEAMNKDVEAWGHMLAAIRLKRDSWRAVVRDFILRRDGVAIKTPFCTASVSKGRTRLDVKDEPEAIKRCKALDALTAYRVEEHLIKKEFEVVYNSRPQFFNGIVEEVTGDPILRISERK